MYCPHCGKELEEGSRFCPACGKPVTCEVNRNGSVIFTRCACSVAKMVGAKITIDGKLYNSLKEKESVEIELPYGKHKVEIKAASNPKYCTEITIDAQNPHLEFQFKIGLSGKAVYCGNDSADKYKHNAPSAQKNTTKTVIQSLCAVIIVFAVACSIFVLKQEPKPVKDNPETSMSSFKPMTGSAGNWQITVNDFDYYQSVSAGLLHEYRAEEGSKYCVVNVTVKNTGSKIDTFLPYISFGNGSNAAISWRGLNYVRSEQLAAEDNLSSESLNPLVSKSGDIVFEVPDEMMTSKDMPIFRITADGEVFECELKKK